MDYLVRRRCKFTTGATFVLLAATMIPYLHAHFTDFTTRLFLLTAL
jgi:hypothetical protein